MNITLEPIRSWAIYIDIEGFSANYVKDQGCVISGLRSLMEGIDRIGNTTCSKRSRRLCAYQAGGDGFFIDSQYGSPNVPIAIAIILMRNALFAGALTTSGISEGECIDVRGWRPDPVRQKAKADYVPLGEAGHMRLFPVIGTAYIRAHRMTKNRRGCLLALDSELASQCSLDRRYIHDNVVDWIHAKLPEIDEIAAAAELPLEDFERLEACLKEKARCAASTFGGSTEWLENTLVFNHCE